MVMDDEIMAAMRLAWERANLLIEPSAAVAVTALLSAEFRDLAGLRRVGIILSGGNVNLDALSWGDPLPTQLRRCGCPFGFRRMWK
jgi:threonine dehydratase